MPRQNHIPVKSWILNEVQSAGKENLDADHVSKYDQKEDASAEAELELLKNHGLNDQSILIDFGCGTGQFTIAAASHCKRVIAVDVSEVMIQQLKSKVTSANLNNVEIVTAGFLTYKHEGKPVDFIYSRYALHHIPDFWKAVAFNNIRKMLQTGGLFRLWDVVYNFSPQQSEEKLDTWCATISKDNTDGWLRSDIEDHIRDEHSTFTWLLELMIERNGFKIEDVSYSPDGIFAQYLLRAV
jgi:cyclopropane fatty-acyl-phospholipid synthase-like methyltransferase